MLITLALLSCQSFSQQKGIKYDLRLKNLLKVQNAKTSTYGQSSLSFRGSILWNTLSDSIQPEYNAKIFQTRFKSLKEENVIATYVDILVIIKIKH